MKIYLAGPMSGYPQFNFPEFHAAAALLRNEGFDVVSPAELDEAETAAHAVLSADGNPNNSPHSWGHYLSRDVKMLADDGIEGIVFLRGWADSRGARLEAFVGMQSRTPFFFFELIDNEVHPMDWRDVLDALSFGTMCNVVKANQ